MAASKTIFSLLQWETRVADMYSMVRCARMTHKDVIRLRDEMLYSELYRKHGGKRAVYPAYITGYVAGLAQAENARLYREFLEFCFVIDGVIYSTHKDSIHRLTEELYSSGRSIEISNATIYGHYWKGSDKPFNV